MNRGYRWQINMANFRQRSDSWVCVRADTTLYNCVSNGRRSLANRCTAPGARICASCHKSSRVARLALLPIRTANSGLRLFTHAGKAHAYTCYQGTIYFSELWPRTNSKDTMLFFPLCMLCQDVSECHPSYSIHSYETPQVA